MIFLNIQAGNSWGIGNIKALFPFGVESPFPKLLRIIADSVKTLSANLAKNSPKLTLKRSKAKSPKELKAIFPSLDNFKYVDKWYVIDIGGNTLRLIALMDSLVDDYNKNKTLIDLLFPVIQRTEEESEQFAEFNARIDSLDPSVSMLRLIIDKNGLTLSDFKEEIGGKSAVSMILSGNRNLTLHHIRALSKRFDIPAYMFV